MQFNGNQFGPQFAPPSISGQIQASQNAFTFGSPAGYGQGTASNYGMGTPQSFGSPYTGGPVGWTAPQMVSPGSSQTTSTGYNSYAFQPAALPWGNFGPSGGQSKTVYTPPTYMQQPIYQQPQQPLIQQVPVQVPVPVEVPKLVQVPVPYQVQVPVQQDNSPTVINNVIDTSQLFGLFQQMQLMQQMQHVQAQPDASAGMAMGDEDSSAMMMMMMFMPMMMNMMAAFDDPMTTEPIYIDPSLDPTLVGDETGDIPPIVWDLTDPVDVGGEDAPIDLPAPSPSVPAPSTSPIAPPPLPTPAPVSKDAEILQLFKELRQLSDPNYVPPSTPTQEREMLGTLDLRIRPATSDVSTRATDHSAYSIGDPHFKHFRSNVKFDCQAVGTYNYISDRNLQVNSELAPWGNNASVNIRTGIKIADLENPGQFKKILVDRDGTVTINGQAITAGSAPVEFATGIPGADGKLKPGFLKYEGNCVIINSGEYEMKITIHRGSHIDFSDVAVTDVGIQADGRRSTGMLGDLADPRAEQRAATDNMGTGAFTRPLSDYKLGGTDLFGDDFNVNQFQAQRLTRSEWGIGAGRVVGS